MTHALVMRERHAHRVERDRDREDKESRESRERYGINTENASVAEIDVQFTEGGHSVRYSGSDIALLADVALASPSSVIRRSPASSSMSTITTLAPFRTNRRTVASPSPAAPPVITATLSSSLVAVQQPSDHHKQHTSSWYYNLFTKHSTNLRHMNLSSKIQKLTS
jgi:hypothetical protein